MHRRAMMGGMAGLSAAMFTPWESSAEDYPKLKGYIRTNWSQDPFAYGSYSYFAKGSGGSDVKALEKPVGQRLFFAGEATYPEHNSTVHAAYESGQRVAGLVLEENVKSVAIVGAGMSGLSAAYKLSKAGIEVSLYEARDRIGGRVWTDNSLGLPLDLGGSWIHGIHKNPLIALSDHVGQPRVKTDDSYIIRNGEGQIIDDDDAPDWLDGVVEVQHSVAADPDQINNLAYLWVDDYEGPDVKFPLGYADIFKALAGDYDIHLSASVTRIELLQSAVALTLENGQKSQFDAVIVTLPLGVLKNQSVEFVPPLPERKQKAITRLGMGTLDKVYLLFNEPFWDEEISWIITLENELPPGQFNQWLNLYKYLDQPVIMAFNGGTPALDLADLSDEVVIGRALNTLKLAYET